MSDEASEEPAWLLHVRSIWEGTDMRQTIHIAPKPHQLRGFTVCAHCKSNNDLFTCFCKVRICGRCQIGCECRNADGSPMYTGNRIDDWMCPGATPEEIAQANAQLAANAAAIALANRPPP